ncbi:transmembrane protein 40 isoform X2 [Pithys albifrons albifrons]|uniref:transmembrane protein 40 isoform X2 n=1 Tax=Pithys albifrons albifrons TaxID=3385563 RepID=UPI003A5CBA3A
MGMRALQQPQRSTECTRRNTNQLYLTTGRQAGGSRITSLVAQPEESGVGTVSNQAGVDHFLLLSGRNSFHHSPPGHLPVEPTARTNLRLAGTAMENLSVLLPDLTEEQEDVFQRAFAADTSYLENHEEMNPSFWESLVKCLAATDPPILNTEEKNNLLNSCDVLPGGCADCLKAIEKKGVRAMAVLYLLLKTSNPSGYRQLPSSKGNDEKLKLLKRLERNLVLSPEEKNKAENSSHESMDEDTQGSLAEMVPYRDSEITRREDSIADAYENESAPQPQWAVRWMGIRKDDEFFHFVILCFAIGALLVCYYYHQDWTISLGIGLITFASLETTGIYFGLVYRIRSVLDSFVPFIDKFRPRGMRKAA